MFAWSETEMVVAAGAIWRELSEWQRDGERGWKDAACAAGGETSKG